MIWNKTHKRRAVLPMSSINEAMNLTMEKLRDMIDVNTVVGKPVTTPDGTTLIPVSKVSFGFASGGTDGKDLRFGAGSGADMIPGILDKFKKDKPEQPPVY